MAAHFALAVAIYLLAAATGGAAAPNVTTLLAGHPELSGFARLLASSPVAADLASRSSITILAVPNPYLSRSIDAARSAADLADVLRYHVLLEYLTIPDLRRVPPSGKLVTTLFQTTGRASADLGALNLTRSHHSLIVRTPTSNATVLSAVAALPYNISILAVDGFLVPYGFDLAASETRPSVGVNITRVLVDARDFNVAATMLAASGVAEEFDGDERGAGITVFVPTDEAFASLPATERLQSLSAEMKAVVLRFHVLHSYYPLGSLESIVNPVQPTLATEDVGAGRYTLNISRVNGSVAIDTGIVQGTITRTVFDQNPVAVFAVSRVLLPREIFGRAPAAASAAEAPPPAVPGGVAPEMPPAARMSSSSSSSSPIGSSETSSDARLGSGIVCTGSMYLLLLVMVL